MTQWITIRGARQHNLKNIDVAIPKNRLVVITGPSGAGKSSLAFDTLYAEGQRRYIESLSPSARQFLTQLERPDVDAIDGLGPAIAIEQRATTGGPRSTVGTASDIHDYLRLLFARLATPYCYRCGRAISGHSVQQVTDWALEQRDAERLIVCAPQRGAPDQGQSGLIARLRREGFVRIRLDGQIRLLEDEIAAPAAGMPAANLELVIDRLSLKNPDRQRLAESIEKAYDLGEGLALLVLTGETERESLFSRTPRCPDCGIAYPQPTPRLFSFNSPDGACPGCHGLGVEEAIDPARVVPDSRKSLADGAIAPWSRSSGPKQVLEQVARHYGFSILEPFSELAPRDQQIVLQGSGEDAIEFAFEGAGSSYRYTRPFEGVIPHLERRYRETESASVREEIRRYMSRRTCRACGGKRLRVESLHHRLGGLSIAELGELPMPRALEWTKSLELGPQDARIAARPLEEAARRLGFLRDVGLHYLALDRSMDTLSSGEAQRIVLATQLGSALSGVIYILDEPTIGLHQRDTERLLESLRRLRDLDNTVIVVEHDREAMGQAEYLIEIGPEAGEGGGQLVAAGTPADLMARADSLTGRYLAGTLRIPVPQRRREPGRQRLRLVGAATHNLKDVTVEIPLGLLVCVTGVSGSGKSSLILDTLYPALSGRIRHQPPEGLALRDLKGAEFVDAVVHVDQAPIGRSSRSNPATYLGAFSRIREHFAVMPEARSRGYTARRFSFNAPGGRCESCRGEGTRRIEMHFLPDVFVRCDACGGTRYNREALDIRYRGKSIADVLDMTVREAAAFFQAVPPVQSRLEPALSVGLGYLRLGQAADTLSGGEAQRLKIARELTRRDTGRTLYLMDEPTTGLHVEDVRRLLDVVEGLVAGGSTVLLIEHHLEVIQCADYVIELGPEAGDEGGRVIASGTPESLLDTAPDSPTARFLRPLLAPAARDSRSPGRGKERVLHVSPTNPV
jgi:excinuclease ABC subunit A